MKHFITLPLFIFAASFVPVLLLWLLATPGTPSAVAIVNMHVALSLGLGWTLAVARLRGEELV